MRFKYIIFLAPLLILGCAPAIEVKPVSSGLAIKHVCIQENPKVSVGDFLQILRDGFDRNGVSSVVYSTDKPSNCEYIVTYTANRRFEAIYGVFLSDASIHIEKDGRYISTAYFHAGAGFVSAKWDSTRNKMKPVIDEMFHKY